MKKKEQIYLSRKKILQKAFEFVDKNGIESLSMRKLASLLNIKAMSLYNHVRNKDEIIDSIVDMVISEIALPNLEQSWQEAMKNRAISAHQVLVHHKWATLPIVSRINKGPCMLNYLEQTIACLTKAGFSITEADQVVNAMDSYIYGFTLIKINFPIAESDYAKAAEEGEKLFPKNNFPMLHDLSRLIRDGKYSGLQDFEFGFNFILEGFEKILKRKL